MRILSSWDLHKGKTGTWDKTGILSQPIQTLSRSKKDKAWKEQNMDWWEHIGVLQLKERYKRLYKNYNLAEGVIDKSDYIPDVTQNDYAEMIDILTKENESPFEIRYYPIIPTIVKMLVGEFAKRSTRLNVKSVDPYAINEMLEKKKEMLTDYVVQNAQRAIAMKLMEQGIELDSEEAIQAQQQVMSLPKIQEFFQKSYRSVAEQWAIHELNEAEERFKLSELEIQGFKDKIITGDEFWHVRLLEDDYEVELWNPINTFYHKSPDVSYVSQGDYVGRIHLLTIPTVIDRFGYLMTDKQIESLQSIVNVWLTKGRIMPSDATTTDYWNPTKKPSEQIQSIHFHDAIVNSTMKDGLFNKPLFEWLKEEDNSFTKDFVIVTEVYWKSQKKMAHLKQVDENGMIFEDVVTEDFKVTMEPVYDTTMKKEKSAETLIYGQHLDYFWVNEVWSGIKIGMSFLNSWAGMSDGFEPIYLNVKPLPFQFKSDGSLYGARLPVEGFLGYNRNVKKMSLVDSMKPFQIGYNMVNNQIVDMMVDEIGKVILLDQNMIPKNSMDGSWGKYNFTKSFQIMKNFGILPVDSSITNTDVPVNFNQTTMVDLDKTNQLVTRIQLSEYFKNECYSSIGISRQRLGEVTSSESATGVEYSVNNSYAQTESYFIEHSNFLMPRVKEMILNAAQFINANKPTVRKTYINKDEENVFFEIEGTKLLLSDLRIFCSSKPDQRAIIDQLKQLAMSNNTSNATIFDLAKIVQSDSVSEILETLKTSVDKAQQQQQEQIRAQEEAVQAQIQAEAELAEAQRQFEAVQNDLNRENERYIAEVRALGFNRENDIDNNDVPDALEVRKFNAEQGRYEDERMMSERKLLAEESKSLKDREIKMRDLELKREKLAQDIKIKQEQIKLARENMKNDLAIARQNAKGRTKSKK